MKAILHFNTGVSVSSHLGIEKLLFNRADVIEYLGKEEIDNALCWLSKFAQKVDVIVVGIDSYRDEHWNVTGVTLGCVLAPENQRGSAVHNIQLWHRGTLHCLQKSVSRVWKILSADNEEERVNGQVEFILADHESIVPQTRAEMIPERSRVFGSAIQLGMPEQYRDKLTIDSNVELGWVV